MLFLVVFYISKYVSLGAIVASIAFPILLIFVFHQSRWSIVLFCSLISVTIIIRHRKNISRLLNGTENKMLQNIPTKSKMEFY